MSARTTMIHRCDIQRDPQIHVSDTWGSSSDPGWVSHLVNVSCWYWYDRSWSIVDGTRQLQMSQPKLLLPIGLDVNDDDRIVSVYDRRGRQIKSGPMRIIDLGTREDHMVLTLAGIQ